MDETVLDELSGRERTHIHPSQGRNHLIGLRKDNIAAWEREITNA